MDPGHLVSIRQQNKGKDSENSPTQVPRVVPTGPNRYVSEASEEAPTATRAGLRDRIEPVANFF